MSDESSIKNDNDAPWTNSIEITVKEFGEKSGVLRLLHKYQRISLSKKDAYIVIPAIIIQVIVSAILNLENSESEKKNNDLNVFLSIFNILSAILFTLSKYLKYSELSNEHKVAELIYGKIYRRIISELSISREYRTPALHFLKTIRTSFDNANERSPNIEHKVIQKFMSKNKDQNISLPDICSGICKIKIANSPVNKYFENHPQNNNNHSEDDYTKENIQNIERKNSEGDNKWI